MSASFAAAAVVIAMAAASLLVAGCSSSGGGEGGPDGAETRPGGEGRPERVEAGAEGAEAAREPGLGGAMNTLTPEERAAGWRLLFDGETTEGWRGYGIDTMPDGWEAVDGTLARVAPAGNIVTAESFWNFELRLEWIVEEGGNSGVFYRVSEEPEAMWHSAPEMQVLDDAGHQDGSDPKTSAGSAYGLYGPVADVVKPAGEWNAARIVVAGSHVEHWLNETKVVEYELGSAEWEELVAESKFSGHPNYGRVERGPIGLQDHGDRVAYRNIKIRTLD